MKPKKKYRMIIRFESRIEIYDSIQKILDIDPSESFENTRRVADNSDWTYEVIEYEGEAEFDFINEFLNILEDKYSRLEELGITEKLIQFDCTYFNENEMSLTFNKDSLKRLDNHNILLSVNHP
jgi:hypothetical protein